MAKGGYVLEMLRPNGGWVITEDDYDSIRWDDGIEPLSREEFLTGFNTVDAWLEQRASATKAQKQAILDRLGLTEDELRIVLG